MLTGDKVDTAISIAMSCKLLTEEMNNFIIDSNTEQRPHRKNKHFQKAVQKKSTDDKK